MKFFTAVVCLTVLALQISSYVACSCRFTDFETQYFRNSASGRDLAEAKVAWTYTRTRRIGEGSFSFRMEERVYVLKVTKTYGCRAVPYYTRATTSTSSASCGISLRRGVAYLLPLKKTGTSQLGLCGITRAATSLTASQTAFLNSREICCDGRCSCRGAHRTPCFVAPCRFARPSCSAATKCVDNYCGGCRAEWFTADGAPACGKGLLASHSVSVSM